MKMRAQRRVLGANELVVYRRLTEFDGPKLLTFRGAKEILGSGVSPNSLTHTLSSLESKAILRRVGKGLYLNQSAGHTPKVLDLIPWLFRPSQFYLGLNAAANHWGLSSQLPQVYHALYTPEGEAQIRRMARWCRALERFEKELGGYLEPVTIRTGRFQKGVSQAILEGVQLPISTIERTLVDSVIYTEEVGGAGDALAWVQAAINKDVDYGELASIVEEVYPSLNSVAARLGLLVETSLRLRPSETQSPPDSFLRNLREMSVRTGATYNWGREGEERRYLREWRIHVSKSFLNQLEGAHNYE